MFLWEIIGGWLVTTLKGHPFPSEDLSNPELGKKSAIQLINTRQLPFRELATSIQFMHLN